MNSFDFAEIRLNHVSWRVRLDGLLEGKLGMTEEEAISDENCAVGKWLYSEGMKKYGVMPEIQELEKIHTTLHSTVKQILAIRKSGENHREREEVEKLDAILRKVMFLLVDIERKLLRT